MDGHHTHEVPTMIEKLTGFPGNVVAFACHGEVTRRDYEAVLVPAVEAALKAHQKVRLYYKTDTDFSGIEPGAMWEDFKIGLMHLSRWERIAVVTDVDWIKATVRAFGFVMPGTVKVFPLAEAVAAHDWIAASGA
jgi:hypothetical protein